jgi:hypothetical protein
MAAFRAMHSFADNVRTAPVFEGIAALLIEACIVPRRSLSMPKRSTCLRGLSTCFNEAMRLLMGTSMPMVSKATPRKIIVAESSGSSDA